MHKGFSFLKNRLVLYFLLSAILGLFIWFLPKPQGVSVEGWKLLSIFVFTVVAIILKPLPMGAITILSITALSITKTLTIDQCFSGFSHNIVWLVVLAFFIAKGFVKTGLGSRIAYLIIEKLGSSTLGLSYGFLATDLFLAPAIPSLTARSGGIIYPVLSSVCHAFGSDPAEHPKKLGSFLFLTAFHGSVVTSAMFLTSMAGNPLAAEIASKAGVTITWGSWALAAIVPGMLSLILIPLVLYRFYPPEIKVTPDAKLYARGKLAELGKVQSKEWIMIFVFLLLLLLWIFGSFLNVNATTTALLGLAFLMMSAVLSWEEIIKEKAAWDTLVWFATLIMMATYLNSFGLTTWFSDFIVSHLKGFSWEVSYVALSFVYFFSHYFFASNVAHIGSMFAPFFFLMIASGTPGMLAALTLSFFSSLFGGLTHYGCGPAPIFFGAGYVKIKDWWKFGLIFGVMNFIIWMFIGGSWWKLLHLF